MGFENFPKKEHVFEKEPAPLNEDFLKKQSGDEALWKTQITELGSQLHDAWRASRWNPEKSAYEPRLKETKDKAWIEKHGGTNQVDIANTRYEDLPSDWQAENKASAEVAVKEVQRALVQELPLNKEFLESASSILHDKWLERNKSWAPPEQQKPYEELSEEEKEKDRVIIQKAIDLFQKKPSE